MNNITKTLLATVALGAVSIGSASAIPLDRLSGVLGVSDVQNVRVVCNQNGQCYNTARRSTRRAYAPRYYGAQQHYAPRYYGAQQHYAAPQYYAASEYYGGPHYGYYGAPQLGVGVGPFGFRVW